jgi:integrase/recombinase XerD
MSRKGDRKPLPPIGDPSNLDGFQNLLDAHVQDLEAHNFSKHTIQNRIVYTRRFALWCLERDLTQPSQVTKAILERYQRALFQYRNAKGAGMSFVTQSGHLMHLRAFFKWLCKTGRIPVNPASEIELPRKGERLPDAVFSIDEVEKIMTQPNISEPIGLRDRAILEVFYACGIRRTELSQLTIYSVDPERQTLLIRQGKGKKDRFIPIGKRAIAWIQKYLQEARPRLIVDSSVQTLFLSNLGQALEPQTLSSYISDYIAKAGIEKTGSCHMFRHSMATHMLDNGADIRFIQVMLGHAKLETTEIYTRVSIKKLQQVYHQTHPAEQPKEAGDVRPEAGENPNEPQDANPPAPSEEAKPPKNPKE